MTSSRRHGAPAQPTTGQLIKSRERVRDLAEVYTAEREVQAMLDLVPQPSLKQTFLEPACGNGNFLVEILRRKLVAHPLTRPYFSHAKTDRPAAYPKAGAAEEALLIAIEAVSAIYGFDICPNNIAETQARLYAYVMYGEDLLLPGFLTGSDPHTLNYIEAVTPGHVLPLAADYEGNLYRFAEKTARLRKTQDRPASLSPLLQSLLKLVLAKNFQQGDFLAQVDSGGQPLTVGRWTFLGGKVRREDFLLSDVGTDNPKPVRVLKLQSLTEFVKGAAHG